MTGPFEENPSPQEQEPNLDQPTSQPELTPASPTPPATESGVASEPEQLPPPFPPGKTYPPDLQITWSWQHLAVFLVFIFISLLTVQGFFVAAYAPHQKMTTEQLEDYMLSKPQVAIGSTVIIYALLLFFLYVTLALLRGQPFWRTLGWRKLPTTINGQSRSPLIYFFVGCGVSLLVFALTSIIQPPENAPIEQVFKFKQTAVLFVATAVLIAPLAEETIFRGYLYPMFARWFGVVPSIIVTGVLFGLMHGPQLGGEKSLIAVMSLVGIVFTTVRARTGSVFASYLMHLGYNSLIAASLLLATHGFTQIPHHH
ncbi:MAG TPA: CPBP family intramembrane glutamic endopeptidase [Candidatus Sulfotelmatobacter sp.]|nr:CPBP family intramembrane glutamic endopeptidase [Candidatus Sulfotelmatobacter sp.]